MAPRHLLPLLLPAAVALACDGKDDGSGNADDEPCELGDVMACELDGAQGERTCIQEEDEDEEDPTWGECLVPTPDDTGGSDTPLLLVFDDRPVQFSASTGELALNPRMSTVTDWPSAATPWLVLDRDGSGAIEDGSELFGSASFLASGRPAEHGFAALGELDRDGNHRIDGADAKFADLALWFDHDGDRRSSPDELRPLADAGVVALELDFAADPRCDARHNCEIERAGFTFSGADGSLRHGALVDVHLAHQRG